MIRSCCNYHCLALVTSNLVINSFSSKKTLFELCLICDFLSSKHAVTESKAWRQSGSSSGKHLSSLMMKSPVHRCRDSEHGRGQSGTNYLQPEQRIPISKDVITSSSASAMWFIRDACGIVCAAITWMLVFYAEFVVLFVMLLPSKNLMYSIVNGAVFNALAFLALASHLRAMCTDPVRWSYLVLFTLLKN